MLRSNPKVSPEYILAEYGRDITDPKERAKWERALTPLDERGYIGLVMSYIPKKSGEARPFYTSPLVCRLGYGHLPPREWARRMPEFLKYWIETTDRPYRFRWRYGVPLEAAFLAWRRGVDPLVMKNAFSRGVLRPEQVVKLMRKPSPKFWRILRALGRGSVGLIPSGMGISLGALAILGRLSPEGQYVVLLNTIDRLEAENRWEITAKDIRWEEVAPVLRQLASPRARAAYATGPRQGVVLGIVPSRFSAKDYNMYPQTIETATVERLTPSFPRLPYRMAVRLAKGEPPVSLAGGVLSAKEAHEWLLYVNHLGMIEPKVWLGRKMGLDDTAIRLASSINVLRWLGEVKRKGMWHKMEKQRDAWGPLGERFSFRFIDLLPELRDVDLVHGINTRVEDAFKSLHDRVEKENWIRFSRDHRIICPPPPWPLPPNVVALCTPAALKKEGEEMGHCAGSQPYIDAVSQGNAYILSIRLGDSRATMEITPQGKIIQLRGPENRRPDPEILRFVYDLARRYGWDRSDMAI